MIITIRTRLTIWYMLAFSSAITLLLVTLAIALDQQFTFGVKKSLKIEEEWVLESFEPNFVQLHAGVGTRQQALLDQLTEEISERYALKNQFAVVAIECPDSIQYVIAGPTEAYQLVPQDYLNKRDGSYEISTKKQHYLLRLTRKPWGWIFLGEDKERLYKFFREVGEILVWIVPFALILAAGGGWLLAKLALRPVAAAAKAAETISVTNLENRLSAYAGRDEFGTLVSTLNRMIARLDEGVGRLQQFTADAAHELRTPLTILRGDLELAYQDEAVSDDARAILQKALDRTIVLGQIVENLMMLALSDTGVYPVSKSRFRLDLAVQEIFEDMQILAEGKTVHSHLNVPEAVEFFGDEHLIRRLLLNLCDNALKYTREGQIEVDLRKTQSEVEFIITDTGIGIPEAEMPLIFDRFYRVSKARSSASGGSGLGLALCKWIVTAHAGVIIVTSKENVGTTVRVSLPLLAEAP